MTTRCFAINIPVGVHRLSLKQLIEFEESHGPYLRWRYIGPGSFCHFVIAGPHLTRRRFGIDIELCYCRSTLGPHVRQPYSDENEAKSLFTLQEPMSREASSSLIQSSFLRGTSNFMMFGFKDLFFAAHLLGLGHLSLIVEIPLRIFEDLTVGIQRTNKHAQSRWYESCEQPNQFGVFE